jgi:hypothetical protein
MNSVMVYKICIQHHSQEYQVLDNFCIIKYFSNLVFVSFVPASFCFLFTVDLKMVSFRFHEY